MAKAKKPKPKPEKAKPVRMAVKLIEGLKDALEHSRGAKQLRSLVKAKSKKTRKI